MTQPNQSELEHELDQLFGTRGMNQEKLKERIIAYITANYTPNTEVNRKLKEAVREARIDCLKITHGHMQTGTKLDDAYFIHNITMLEAELLKEVK